MGTNTVESLRESLNRADPNTYPDMLRALAFGDVLRALPVYLQGTTAVASAPGQATGLVTVVLPEDAKAATILRCTARKAAPGKTGEYAPIAYSAGAQPATTKVSVAPNGDIVFFASDAPTQIDLIYVPQKGYVKGQLANMKFGVSSMTLQVAANGAAALPAQYAGKAVLLMAATINTGTNTGACIVLAPQSSATTTKTAALSLLGDAVWFDAIDDAPTSVTVDLLIVSGIIDGVDMNTLLEGASSDA
jgi:hypothetical protein